jgi:hypothetical protein
LKSTKVSVGDVDGSGYTLRITQNAARKIRRIDLILNERTYTSSGSASGESSLCRVDWRDERRGTMEDSAMLFRELVLKWITISPVDQRRKGKTHDGGLVAAREFDVDVL